MSSRRASRTPIDAVSVVIGLRNSWDTSEVNRASCSIRVSRLAAMWLNVSTMRSRSGSEVSSSRVPSRPLAIASAARPIAPRGRSTPRLTHQPSAMPNSVVPIIVINRTFASVFRVWEMSWSDTIS